MAMPTVILFYPIIADNKRFAIFLTHVKSVACAKKKITVPMPAPAPGAEQMPQFGAALQRNQDDELWRPIL
jgi:hypothetical protein